MPLAIFVPYLLLELLAFTGVAKLIGVGWALLALFVVFFLGIAIAASQLRAISARLRSRRISPGQAMGDYGLTAAGAMCLALPGFVSSVAGLLLIFPPTRAMARRMTARKLRTKVEAMGIRGFEATNAYRKKASYGRFGTAAQGSAEVIDEQEIQEWTSKVNPEDFGTPGRGDK